MLRSLNLHRTGKTADWHKVAKEKRNLWQRTASSTHGILTPGNFISVLGGAVTIVGLVRITNDLNLYNIALIILGRLADIADGHVAHKTSTKSPLGEMIDATIDKILAFVAVIALAWSELAPLLIIALVLLYSLANSIISITAKLRSISIHPSREGKFAGAACWGVIAFYPLYTFLRDNNYAISTVALAAALIFSALFIWYGWRSMAEYYKLIREYQGDK